MRAAVDQAPQGQPLQQPKDPILTPIAILPLPSIIPHHQHHQYQHHRHLNSPSIINPVLSPTGSSYPPLIGPHNAIVESPLPSPTSHHLSSYDINSSPSTSTSIASPSAISRIRRGPESSIAARAAALALYSEGVKPKDIEAKCGISRVAFAKLLGRARKRGFVPGKPVLMEHVVDAPRSGRPKKPVAS